MGWVMLDKGGVIYTKPDFLRVLQPIRPHAVHIYMFMMFPTTSTCSFNVNIYCTCTHTLTEVEK